MRKRPDTRSQDSASAPELPSRVYAYTVWVRINPPGEPFKPEHVHAVDVLAYNGVEAATQAGMELDTRFNISANGYQIRILTLGPTCDAMTARTAQLLTDLIFATERNQTNA